MKKLKENGITLIALIITIIILLILAGVTISLIWNGGIINKTQQSVDIYGKEAAREKLLLCLTDYKFGKLKGDNIQLRDKLNEVDDTHNVTETGDGKYYIVTIDGYIFYVDKEKGEIVDLSGDNANFPLTEPGTYRMTVNAGQQAKWIQLIKYNEVIPNGTRIEYKFQTSNDRNEWRDWNSIEEINEANVKSQYLKVIATLVGNESTGAKPSLAGLRVRFRLGTEEEIVALENNPDIEEKDGEYQLKAGKTSSVVTQIITLPSEMNASVIANSITYPIITTTTVESGATTTNQVNSKDVARVYVGIDNGTGTEWININEAISGNSTYSHVKIEVPITSGQTVGKAGLNNAEKASETAGKEWITVETKYYMANSVSELGEWTSIDKDETNYENSRIVYSFAKSNDDINYTSYSTDIKANNPSKYIIVKAEIQIVKGENVPQRSQINDLYINYKLNGTDKKVKANTRADLVIDKQEINIAITQEVELFANYQGKNVTESTQWSSNNENIVTVSSGKITGIATGTTEIIATYNGKIAKCTVTVDETISEIYSLEDLQLLAKQVNELGITFEQKVITLKQDVDLNFGKYKIENGELKFDDDANQWTPIGTATNTFQGTFDGKGHTISNMFINNSSDYQGFFGVNEGIIENVKINGKINAKNYVGGIAGYNKKTIRNCENNSVIGLNNVGGGIAGTNDSIIENCSNKSNVTGTYGNVGGIAGTNCGTVKKCYNTGYILTGMYTAGGIVGHHAEGYIYNCYNIGKVYGGTYAGGIVAAGGIPGRSTAYIYNCYTTQNAEGVHNVGNIIGLKNANGGTSFDDNCYDTKVTASTFNNHEYGDDAWMDDVKDMDDNWMYNDGYPILKWQIQ